MGKLVCGLLRPPSVIIFFALSCVHPSCVEVIEIVIWVCGYPSCEEVIVVGLALCLIPLSVEVIVVWLSALSLLCEVIVVVPCLLCRGGVVGEWSYVLLSLYLQIPRWRFPVWEVLCGDSGNPSV